jgi:hypothetical protein
MEASMALPQPVAALVLPVAIYLLQPEVTCPEPPAFYGALINEDCGRYFELLR